MPTTYFHRLWCKTCKHWTLHSKAFKAESPYKCNGCQTIHVRTLLSEIPKDKILEQRERYKKNIAESILMGGILMSNPLDSMFSEDFPTEIVESDAGQKKIDEKIAEKRKKEYEKKELERQKQREEALKYNNLGRNDICICGTGKKYKKCCQPRINKIL